MEKISNVCLLIFLFIVAFKDLKTKEVSIKLCGVFSGIGLLLIILKIMSGYEISLLSLLGGMALGAAFLLISAFSRGALGMGDGLVMTICGLYMGFEINLEIIFLAFLASAIIGSILWIMKKKRKKETIAFLPFVMAGYVLSII